MQLTTALDQLLKSPATTGLFRLVLKGYGPPGPLASTLCEQLTQRADTGQIDLEQSSLEQAKALLEMSFLGQHKLYILKGYDGLTAAKKKPWKAYITSYQGPHTLVYFESRGPVPRGRATIKPLTEQDDAHQVVIALPHECDQRLYSQLAAYVYPDVVCDPAFARQVFTAGPLASDDAIRMMRYHVLIGRRHEDFFAQWQAKIVVQDASLFLLSQYFFAGQMRNFMQLWKQCKAQYPVEFFIAYWSQQLYQAVQFRMQAQAGNTRTQKGEYRLPFSYLNSDWRRHSLESLALAHDRLYKLDFALKNGADSYGIELWYHRFLAEPGRI